MRLPRIDRNRDPSPICAGMRRRPLNYFVHGLTLVSDIPLSLPPLERPEIGRPIVKFAAIGKSRKRTNSGLAIASDT